MTVKKKTAKKTAKVAPTELLVILDRSGSMISMKTDVEGGFDNFVAEQRKLPGEARLTLVQFDTVGVDTVYESATLGDVKPLTLVPRGGTPLLDAVGKALTQTEQRVPKETKALVVIITDGHENSSSEFTKDSVAKLVKRLEAERSWGFIFLGANIDAFAEAGALGMTTLQAANFTPTSAKRAFDISSNKAAMYRSAVGGGLSGQSLVSTANLLPDEQDELAKGE